MKKNIFIKKYWKEEDTWFYISFENGIATKQVEIHPLKNKIFLSFENPIQNGSMLYDQSIDDLNITENEFITEDEFNTIWNNK